MIRVVTTEKERRVTKERSSRHHRAEEMGRGDEGQED